MTSTMQGTSTPKHKLLCKPTRPHHLAYEPLGLIEPTLSYRTWPNHGPNFGSRKSGLNRVG